ncbi:MAG: hypothetical protein QF752_00110 [Planctomycetota bacterium]|jgi:hypothetical protein|nr:hypothetical protein [Planctomycetota bacterium]
MKLPKSLIQPFLLTLALSFGCLFPNSVQAQQEEDNAEELRNRRRELLKKFERSDSNSFREQIYKYLIRMRLNDKIRDRANSDYLPSASEVDGWFGWVPVSSALGLGGALANDGDLNERDIQKVIGLVAKDGITPEEKEDLLDIYDMYGDTMTTESLEVMEELIEGGDDESKYKLTSKNPTWTSTYFPMAGSGIDDEGDSQDNLWAKDGAMHKLDSVIEERTGTRGTAYETESRPALNWLIGEKKGYWVANSRLSEKDAERTTGVDLNRNGKIDPDVEWDFIDSRGNFGEDGKKDGTMGVGWWGRCNNVGIAGTLFKEPKKDVTLNGVTFTATEIKGLLSVYSDTILNSKGSEFEGSRYDDRPDELVTRDGKRLSGVIENARELDLDGEGMKRSTNYRHGGDYIILDGDALEDRGKDIRFRDLATGEVTTYKPEEVRSVAKEDSKQDIEARVFHNNMTEWLADGRSGVLEMDPGSHVWNYNFESADIHETKTRPHWAPEDRKDLRGYDGPPGDGEITYVEARMRYDGGGSSQTYRYWIEKNRSGTVVNSGWSSKNPDFMWRAKESEVDWSRKVPGHPSLDGNILRELYEKSTAEDSSDNQ